MSVGPRVFIWVFLIKLPEDIWFMSMASLVYVDGIFTHTRSVRYKAKLVDAGEYQLEEEPERLGFEDAMVPLPRRRRIHGKSAPPVAVLQCNPNLEPYDDDSPSDQEEI